MVRVPQLQPTVFIDAVPELAAARSQRPEAEELGEAEDAEPPRARAA